MLDGIGGEGQAGVVAREEAEDAGRVRRMRRGKEKSLFRTKGS